jgi:hypothetical protein
VSALRTTETAKARYLLAYARGASHAEAAKEAGAARRSFYEARERDPEFGRACKAVYEARVAAEMGTRAELVEGLREASGYFAHAADQLERSSFAWFSLREGLIGALEEFDERLERSGLEAGPDISPQGVTRALEGAGLAGLPSAAAVEGDTDKQIGDRAEPARVEIEVARDRFWKRPAS